MIVIVTGGRALSLEGCRALRASLEYLHTHGRRDWKRIDALFEGGARGADTAAREWAHARLVPTCTFPADWSKGRRAGPERNRAMLSAAECLAMGWDAELVVLAAPGGAGTRNCMQLARQRGLEVREVAT